jgi:hypothetical protein
MTNFSFFIKAPSIYGFAIKAISTFVQLAYARPVPAQSGETAPLETAFRTADVRIGAFDGALHIDVTCLVPTRLHLHGNRLAQRLHSAARTFTVDRTHHAENFLLESRPYTDPACRILLL